MKLGKTKEERQKKLEVEIELRKKKVEWFAWFPVYCENTQRSVWLENVITFEVYDLSWRRFYRYYKEIV